MGKGFANAEITDTLVVKNLDHLGLIAGIVDELGVVEIVNECDGAYLNSGEGVAIAGKHAH